jgi:hypothetical protein
MGVGEERQHGIAVTNMEYGKERIAAMGKFSSMKYVASSHSNATISSIKKDSRRLGPRSIRPQPCAEKSSESGAATIDNELTVPLVLAARTNPRSVDGK